MKLLLAIDGSVLSDTAVHAVASRVQPPGTEILVLEVVEPHTFSVPPEMEPGYAPEQEAVLKSQIAEAKRNVSRAAKELEAAGFDATTRILEGEVRSSILDLAAEWRADLIVVGSHGRRGLHRFLMGSVAQDVARHAHCSVWIVRASS